MGTKPKLWSNHEAEAKVLTFSKHKAEAEARPRCLPAIINTYPFYDYVSFVEIYAKYTGKHDLRIKNVGFSSFETAKTKRNILDLWGYKAEASPNSRNWSLNFEFWNHEAEALASRTAEAALYSCLAISGIS